MPRKISLPNGRSVSVPDDATDAQIQDFVNANLDSIMGNTFAQPKPSPASAATKPPAPSGPPIEALSGATGIGPDKPALMGLTTQGRLRHGANIAATEIPTALAILGSRIPVVGTALGAAGGKGLEIAAKSALDPETQKRYSGLPGAGRALWDIGKAGVEGAASDYLLGTIFGKGEQALAGRYVPRQALRAESARGADRAAEQAAFEAAQETKAAAARAKASGISPKPAPVEPSIPKLTPAERIGPPTGKAELSAPTAKAKLVKSYQTLGKTKAADTVETEAIGGIHESVNNFRDVFAKRYEDLDQMATAAKRKSYVDGNDIIKDFTAPTTKNLRQARVQAMAPGSAGKTAFEQNIENDIIGLRDLKMNFMDAHMLRSRWLAMARGEGTHMEQAIAAAERASAAIDQAMEKGAKREGGLLYSKWRAVNGEYREGKEIIHHKLVDRLLNVGALDNPKVLDSIVRTPADARAVREAITRYGGKAGEKRWADIQRQVLERVIMEPVKITKAAGKIGEETLNEIFDTPRAYELLQRTKDTGEALRRYDELAKASPGLTAKFYESGTIPGSERGRFSVFGFPDFIDRVGASVWARIAESPAASRMLKSGVTMAEKNLPQGVALVKRAVLEGGGENAVIRGWGKLGMLPKWLRRDAPGTGVLRNIPRALRLGIKTDRIASGDTPTGAEADWAISGGTLNPSTVPYELPPQR